LDPLKKQKRPKRRLVGQGPQARGSGLGELEEVHAVRRKKRGSCLETCNKQEGEGKEHQKKKIVENWKGYHQGKVGELDWGRWGQKRAIGEEKNYVLLP